MQTVTGLYGFCAAVGGILTLVVLAGGLGDADVNGHFGGHLNGDHAGPLASILSLRALVFTLAFFGITGLVLPLVGAGTVATFGAAVGVGAFTGYLNGRVLGYLNRTGGGSIAPEQSLSGTPARVMLPVGDGRRGRVEIEVGGRTTSLVAEPFRSGAGTFSIGTTVVVVEVEAGVAKVAPFGPLAHDIS